MKSRILLLVSLFYFPCCLFAQSLYEVSLNEKTTNSPLIIEGKVIDQTSFWNSNHTMIYTSNKIEVYKVFKGSLTQSEIEVVTMGGSVENEGVQISEVLKLAPNQVGAFFLYPNKINLKSPKTLQRLWDVYSSGQGFIRYDLNKETASAPFVKYKNISTDFYKDIRTRTNRNYENKKPSFSVSALSHKNTRELTTLAPVISSFSPAMVTAGALLDPTNNVLTISGSGFGVGAASAAVIFDDADDGPGGTPFSVAYNDPLVISWTDTQIQLRVPTEAGTGALQVQTAGGIMATAPANLEVLYSIQTSSGKETTLVNANGSGGYTVSYSTNTAGNGINLDTDPAKQTFQRALNTWKEVTGANIIEGGTTTIQAVAFDGVNTIMYDNQNTTMAPLPSGVLAVCLNWFSGCPGNPSGQARKREFEVIVYNPAVSLGTPTFTSGPCPPNSSNVNALDLETVILHELGHALNLGHIIDGYKGGIIGRLDPNKLMNYALINSVRRNTPDYSAKAGALYTITPQGSITGACTFSPEMVPLTATTETKDDCPGSFPVTPTSPGTVVNFDLVHANSNRFVDPAYTQIRCGSSNGAAITNNAYYVFRTSASGLLSMTVSGYTTTPAAIASCPSVLGGGQPATGIRLVIYQVSSCPTAGSFPTPFACRTISADGALSDVMSLTANTNYLMYLEGIENTKASFSVAMGGTALPIRFESFTGNVMSDYNKLNWVIDYSYNVKELILEKSSNGTDYFAIDSTEGNYLLPKDFYNDTKPFTGKNFYRLAVINTDGSKQYSDVVLLVRNDKFLAVVYPNPASSSLNIEINTVKNGKYNLELYSSTGQLVRKQAYEIAAPRQIIHLPVASMANGSYFLKISNDKNETLQNTAVLVSH